MEEILRKIIEAGIKAPSGENCQPWKFVINKGEIDLFNLPERDNSLYSWGQRASYVAHGALLENMFIAASEFGYRLEITLFPEKNNSDFVARISPIKTSVSKNHLFGCINRRVTNRKPYQPVLLTPIQQEEILRVSQFGGARFILGTVGDTKKVIARAVSTNEEILLENRKLHKFFFGHINWVEKEDREKSIGFYIKTLELPPPAQIAFKLFSRWPLLRILNFIGASKFVARENAKVYASSAAFGVITIETKEPEDFVAAGRLMQRIWLTVTWLGLSLQPLTGILFLRHRVESGETTDLSPKHINLINDNYEKIRKCFNLNSKIVCMLFRIGQGGNPSARSSRLPPYVEVI